MKYCPTCQTEYDDEIMRFCTKDGTPLVDKDAPKFTEIPSETSEEPDDDDEYKTVIRRDEPPASETKNLSATDAPEQDEEDKKQPERIVISTKGGAGGSRAEQSVRAKPAANARAAQAEPLRRESNTATVVLLTMLGTIVLIAGGIGIYWFLSGSADESANENINVNTDINENLDENFNSDDLFDNANENLDENSNINTNADTPTPSPTKTPTPMPSPDDDDDANTNTNTGSPSPTLSPPPPSPTASPRPTTAPTAAPSPPPPPPNSNRPVNVGTVNGRALSLPTPAYPSEARQVRASGRVTVRVTIDESGNVISANATGGHPLLRRAAETAALRSKFQPVRVSGVPRRAVGTVVYNFVN